MSTDVKRSRITVNLSLLKQRDRSADRSIERSKSSSLHECWNGGGGNGRRNRGDSGGHRCPEIKSEERTLICRLQGPGNLPFAVTRPVQGSSSPVIARRTVHLHAPFSHFPSSTPFSKTCFELRRVTIRTSALLLFSYLARARDQSIFYIYIYIYMYVYWKMNRSDRWKNDKRAEQIIRNNLHPIRNNCAIVSLPSITDYHCLFSDQLTLRSPAPSS